MNKLTAFQRYLEEALTIDNDDDFLKLINQTSKMEIEQIEYAYKAGYDMRDAYNWEGNIEWDNEENKEKLKKYLKKKYQ
jgi:hypothetical protein